MSARPRDFARLGEGTFDVCVIGAGILGSRIAYEATRDGLRVALVDAGDIGGATSSVSSKFIHGGLRYLVQGHLDVVRASLLEKHAIVRDIAPGLARPMPVVVSVERRGWSGALVQRAVLQAYDALGGWSAARTRLITDEDARRLVPALAGRPLGGCLLLDEAQVNDARLTLVTALAAADAGAVVANHARVTALGFANGGAQLDVRGPEGDVTVRAKSVVNATGAWIDTVRTWEDTSATPIARLSKGVHVVVPVEEPWRAALSVHTDDEHNLFAAPWCGGLLVGVTDTPFDGAPTSLAVGPTDADVDLLLQLAQRMLPAHLLRRERIRRVTAGLRVLPRGDGSTATAKRETIVDVGPRGMVSIGGGKLTTHRLEAMDALQHLPASVRPRRRAPSRATLVGRPRPDGADGGGGARADARRGLSSETLAHLEALYGDGVGDVLAHAEGDPAALERIHPDGPDIWAQVRHAVASEWALGVDDVIDRRTTLGWRGLADEATRERIARVLLATPVPA